MAKSDQKIAISVKNLTKSFRLPIGKGQSVKNRMLGRVKQGHIEFTPLKGISFDVHEGDFFGIVGRNGSGKSTLLKTIAGIYQPSKGKVTVNGKLVPFIELGVGFNPELSGRDNVYLNMALLGFSRDETAELYKDIVDFAELHDFMEERLVNYSSGMQVRLAFSIAIRAKGDILLLDEVLAVGDSAFQQKCFNYFDKLKHENKTVILVTHSMANVERFCNRGILLEEGSISFSGDSEGVAAAYSRLFAGPSAWSKSGGPPAEGFVEEEALHLEDVGVVRGGEGVNKLAPYDKFKVSISFTVKRALNDLNVGFVIKNKNGLVIVSKDIFSLTNKYVTAKSGERLVIDFEMENILSNDAYRIDTIISERSGLGRHRVVDLQNVELFEVAGFRHNLNSLIHPEVKVRLRGN